MSYSPQQLAEAFIKAGELEDALAALHDHLSAHEDDVTMRRLRAEVLIRLHTPENMQQAQRDLQAIEQKTPSDYFMLAVAQESLDDMNGAAATLKVGCQHYPHDQRLRERWLHNLLKAKKLEEATALIEAMLVAQSDDWRWWQWAGDTAVQLSQFDKAAETYQQAVQLLEARYHLNQDSPVHVTHGSIDPAALSVGGSYARLHVALADALLANQQREDAESWFNKAALLLPDDPVIPFKLGMIAAQQGRIEEAVNLCQSALNNMPTAIRENAINTLRAHSVYTSLLSQIQ